MTDKKLDLLPLDPAIPLPHPQSTGYWLHRLAHDMRHCLETELRGTDVTGAQWPALGHICLGLATTGAELSRRLRIDGTAVTRLIDRLAAKGYVERVPDPNDRRVQRLEPTPAALTLMPKMLAASKRMNEHVLGVLEEDERAAFQRTLMKLVAQAELAAEDGIPDLQVEEAR